MKKTALVGLFTLLLASQDLLSQESTCARAIDCNANCEHCDTSSVSQIPFSEHLSGWLKSQPRFTTLFAIHFATEDSVPAVRTACASETEGIQQVGDKLKIPRISNPMKFSTALPVSLGKVVDEVISCGHRICNGKQCVEVSDETVQGDDCQSNAKNEDNQPIIMVPAAPPAPPEEFIAQTEGVTADPLLDSILDDQIAKPNVPVPFGAFVRLMMDRAALVTRLEMNEQLSMERAAAMEQILALSDKNAKLATQLAVAEARQQYTDSLATSLAEKAEQAIKKAAPLSITSTELNESNTQSSAMKAVQEDLANIRKQMSLLRRTQPVPFAPSSVGLPYRPYVPTAQIVGPTQDAPSIETETTVPGSATIK